MNMFYREVRRIDSVLSGLYNRAEPWARGSNGQERVGNWQQIQVGPEWRNKDDRKTRKDTDDLQILLIHPDFEDISFR